MQLLLASIDSKLYSSRSSTVVLFVHFGIFGESCFMFVDSTIKNGVKNIVSLRKDFFFDSPLMLPIFVTRLHKLLVGLPMQQAASLIIYTIRRTERIG